MAEVNSCRYFASESHPEARSSVLLLGSVALAPLCAEIVRFQFWTFVFRNCTMVSAAANSCPCDRGTTCRAATGIRQQTNETKSPTRRAVGQLVDVSRRGHSRRNSCARSRHSCPLLM